MRRQLRRCGVNGLVFGLVWLFSGCEAVHEYSLTYKVWSTDDFNRWSEPEANPSLALFETPDHANLLVAYDAYSETHILNPQALPSVSSSRRLRSLATR